MAAGALRLATGPVAGKLVGEMSVTADMEN